jgi:hypothetical protein
MTLPPGTSKATSHAAAIAIARGLHPDCAIVFIALVPITSRSVEEAATLGWRIDVAGACLADMPLLQMTKSALPWQDRHDGPMDVGCPGVV